MAKIEKTLTMKKVLRLINFLLLIVIISCNKKELNTLDFQLKPVTIKGKIENYNSETKTGILRHFDAVTFIHKTDVFAFDSSGNFEINFDVLHEGLGYTILEIQDSRYSLYIEPNKDYNIIIKDRIIKFLSPENDINNELNSFEKALYNKLGNEIRKAELAHNENITIDEYVKVQKDIENKKFAFLESFIDTCKLSDLSINLLKNKFRYATANSWLNIKYNYTSGRPVLRDTLPSDFFEKIFKEYPVNTNDSYKVLEYTHYLANIKEVLDKTKKSPTSERIDFYKQFNVFTENELKLIAGAYDRDTSIINSEEFKQFDANKQKRMDEYKVRQRYRIQSIMDNCSELSKGKGRDFVLSQAIAKYYFENDYYPTDTEWKRLEELFSQKSIVDYLKSISPTENVTIKEADDKPLKNPTEEFTKLTVEKYLKKHIGKVIYIDFWATWCAPCKAQIPHAKALHIELEGKDIAFVNFCVRSEMETWKKLIDKEQITGENYLLNTDEYNILTQYFNVSSYPTYILIGKDGKVKNYNAPRPSSKNEIIDEINSLL